MEYLRAIPPRKGSAFDPAVDVHCLHGFEGSSETDGTDSARESGNTPGPGVVMRMGSDTKESKGETKAYAKFQGKIGTQSFVAFVMQPKPVLVGRGSSSTKGAMAIQLKDPHISRRHLRIAYNPRKNGYEMDVMGKNGAVVNGTCRSGSLAHPFTVHTRDRLVASQVGSTSRDAPVSPSATSRPCRRAPCGSTS